MALRSTQPPSEMSSRNLPEGKDNLTTICEPIVYEMREPQRPTIPWPPRPVTGIDLLVIIRNVNVTPNSEGGITASLLVRR
jgi:hypothetical protein